MTRHHCKGKAKLVFTRPCKGENSDDLLPSPLTKDAEGYGNEEAVTITLGPEQIRVASLFLDLRLKCDRFLNLCHFKYDDSSVSIATTMIGSEYGLGFFTPAIGNEPARKFGTGESPAN